MNPDTGLWIALFALVAVIFVLLLIVGAIVVVVGRTLMHEWRRR